MPGLLKGQFRSPQTRDLARRYMPYLCGGLAALLVVWIRDSGWGRLAAWGVLFCYCLLQTFGPSVLRRPHEASEHVKEGLRSRRWFRISVKILGCVVEATFVSLFMWTTTFWQTYVGFIAVVLGISAYFGVIQRRKDRVQNKWRQQGLCPECGYDWRSIDGEPRCPECGYERAQPVAEPLPEPTQLSPRTPLRQRVGPPATTRTPGLCSLRRRHDRAGGGSNLP